MIQRKTIIYAIFSGGSIVLLILLTYLLPLIFQPPLPPDDPARVPDSEATKIAEEKPDMIIQPFKRTITVKGEDEVEISADRAEIIQGQTNIFILRNIQQAVFYGRDGKKYNISALEGRWDESSRKVVITGNVMCTVDRPDDSPVQLRCEWLNYDFNLKLLNGGGRIFLDSGPYHAEGESIAVNLNINTITLDGRVVTRIDSEVLKNDKIDSTDPLIITARRLKYYQDAQVLEYMGNPYATRGNDTLKAGTLSIYIGTEPEIISRLGVEIHLSGESLALEGPPQPIVINATQMRSNYKAGEIIFWGSVQVKQVQRSLSADLIRVHFDETGSDIAGIIAQNQVFYREQDLTAMSDNAVYNRDENLVMLTGNAEVAHGVENKIKALVIRFYPNQKYYSAEQNVEMQFKIPDKGAADNTGSDWVSSGSIPRFKPGSLLKTWSNQSEYDQDKGVITLQGQVRGQQDTYNFGADTVSVSIDQVTQELSKIEADQNVNLNQDDKVVTCDHLEYSGPEQISILTGNCNIWQNKDQIKAGKVVVNHVSGLVEMEKEVKVTITTAPAANPAFQTTPRTAVPDATVIRIFSDKGQYHQKDGRIDFNGKVRALWDQWEIGSDQMIITLDPITKKLLKTDASGHITVKQNDFNATGSTLTYLVEQSIIVLKGSDTEKARVWRGERGSEANEITFNINENRFRIEDGISVLMPDQLSETFR